MTRAVTVQADELMVRDAAVFGAGQTHQARRFACRVLALPEVRNLTIDPATAEARIAYRVPPESRKDFLIHLADAVAAGNGRLDEAVLPSWPDGEAVTLTRAGDVVTTLNVLDAVPGRVRFRHQRFTAPNETVAWRTAHALRSLPGVRRAAASGGTLTLHYDPSRIDTRSVIRAAEMQLSAEGPPAEAGHLPTVSIGISNTTLGLSTLGELLLPLATPLAAGILVAINLSTGRDALAQLGRGKAGIPVARIALLTCTLATGQVIAAALTDWSLRFWQRRWRRQLVDETQRLVEEALPEPTQVRVLASDGTCRPFPVGMLEAGNRIRVEAGEHLPADGRIVAGAALVDESRIRGPGGPVRKAAGDPAFAGTTVHVGWLGVEVERTGSATLTARIAQTLATVTMGFPRDAALKRRSERVTERAILPTLVTAGVGFAAGGLATMGPILRQDWISGPVLAVPLVTLTHLRSALRSGTLVLSGDAIPRLAGCDFLVVDGDDPLLVAPALELAHLQSRLPDGDTVLRYVAGAGLYLGDERSQALADACRSRALAVRQPRLVALEAGRVEVQQGGHRLQLIDGAPPPAGGAPELQAVIDGHEVARLSFRRGIRPTAAEALARLRAAGLQIAVVSNRSDRETEALAQVLGANLAGGELDVAARARFLQGLRRRGLRPVYVGRLREQPELVREAEVAVDVGALPGDPDDMAAVGDAVLLGRSYEALADLVALSKTHEAEIRKASRQAMIPNLLCVAGGFGGVMTGIGANIVANLGVLNVDRSLRQATRGTDRPGGSRRRLTPG
ncbi:MAG: cation-transporting ATPase [Pseudomonadota bacterium]